MEVYVCAFPAFVHAPSRLCPAAQDLCWGAGGDPGCWWGPMPGCRSTAKEFSVIASFLFFSGIFISLKSPWQLRNPTLLCGAFPPPLGHAQARALEHLTWSLVGTLANSKAPACAFLAGGGEGPAGGEKLRKHLDLGVSRCQGFCMSHWPVIWMLLHV